MIINNFHNVIFIITVQVFHQHYYDEVTQVKCSLSRSDGDESIPNQLVIYSLHKPHSPAKVRYWSPSQLSRNLEFARNHMYLGADRLHFGLIIPPPCPTTPAPAQCAAGNLLSPNNLPASRSKGTLFDQLNVRRAFNMTWGPTTVGP